MIETKTDHMDLLIAAATRLEEATKLLQQVQQALIAERLQAVADVLRVALTPTEPTRH